MWMATPTLGIVGFLLSLGLALSVQPLATPARVKDAVAPALPVQAYGGGEVVLEVTVAPNGAVAGVETIRSTPPFTEVVARATSEWRFGPATATIDGRATPVRTSVLVVAAFRAPTLYAAPAPGGQPATTGAASTAVPQLVSIAPAAYPPNARGDGVVIVEIELTRFAAARGYRIVTPQSGFDNAALDAVRAWRFNAPRDSNAPERLYAYAVLGFKEPVAR
jgi:TonB family protein